MHGDTAEVGNGKHFGDPSVTLGLDITYQARASELRHRHGAVAGVLEPAIHKGIDTNWVLSVRWQH